MGCKWGASRVQLGYVWGLPEKRSPPQSVVYTKSNKSVIQTPKNDKNEHTQNGV